MRAYEEIAATARPGMAFSNSTEGYGWMASWCDECVHDDDEAELYCPLLTFAMLGQGTPSEWIEGERFSIRDRYQCVEFDRRDDGGGDDGPERVPGPGPGQLELLPEPAHTVRMLTPYRPEREPVPAARG